MRIKQFLTVTLAIALIIINCNPVFSLEDETVFNPNFYLSKYSDLYQVFGDDDNAATMHWVNSGIYEGRQGSSVFDVNFYLQNNSDLYQVFGNDYHAATMHWINYGVYEGRQCSSSADNGDAGKSTGDDDVKSTGDEK